MNPDAHDIQEGQGRRAALMVHALAAADRQWLLEQLGTQERTQLQGMLSELQVLGIPASRSLVHDALAAAATASPALTPIRTRPAPVPIVQPTVEAAETAAADSPFQQHCAALRAFSVEPLVAVLQHEPTHLIAHLLRIEEWPWRQRFLEHLGETRRRAVVDVLSHLQRDAAPAPAALQRAVVAALVARTAAAATVAAPAAHATPAARRVQWIRQWLSVRKGRA
ncbi:MAG TPA: hypothetical protein VNB23_05705 [Ramlibacter sp.]|nr:hypothetical protein [Ramlibacter sp.]